MSASRWYLGLFDEKKTETRIAIAEAADIYKHAAHLKGTVGRYVGSAVGAADGS